LQQSTLSVFGIDFLDKYIGLGKNKIFCFANKPCDFSRYLTTW